MRVSSLRPHNCNSFRGPLQRNWQFEVEGLEDGPVRHLIGQDNGQLGVDEECRDALPTSLCQTVNAREGSHFHVSRLILKSEIVHFLQRSSGQRCKFDTRSSIYLQPWLWLRKLFSQTLFLAHFLFRLLEGKKVHSEIAIPFERERPTVPTIDSRLQRQWPVECARQSSELCRKMSSNTRSDCSRLAESNNSTAKGTLCIPSVENMPTCSFSLKISSSRMTNWSSSFLS